MCIDIINYVGLKNILFGKKLIFKLIVIFFLEFILCY